MKSNVTVQLFLIATLCCTSFAQSMEKNDIEKESVVYRIVFEDKDSNILTERYEDDASICSKVNSGGSARPLYFYEKKEKFEPNGKMFYHNSMVWSSHGSVGVGWDIVERGFHILKYRYEQQNK
jgi:hypothetical protein